MDHTRIPSVYPFSRLVTVAPFLGKDRLMKFECVNLFHFNAILAAFVRFNLQCTRLQPFDLSSQAESMAIYQQGVMHTRSDVHFYYGLSDYTWL